MGSRPAILLSLLSLATLTSPAACQSEVTEPPCLANLSLEDLLKVKLTAASLRAQSMAEAPANVTVITHDEIQAFGFRTLSEVLSYVRGFFVSTDRTYDYAGVRGINLLGDFGRRHLLLLDGHNLAAAVDNSVNAFGQDFPVDLSLVRQIEIVRGPSSAIYGGNGILATINIVTFKPGELPRASVRTELASLGERKLQMSASARLSRQASALVSASLFHNGGEESIPVSAAGRSWNAEGMDGEKGVHLFSRFDWNSWTFTALFGSREKVQPVSWGETVKNDPGTRAADTRAFAEARYKRDMGERVTFNWRAAYDASRYLGIYHMPDAETDATLDNREIYKGDWLGTQATWLVQAGRYGAVTMGAEARVEMRARIRIEDVQPEAHLDMDLNKPDRNLAVFLEDAIPLGLKWTMHAGVRLDRSHLYGTVASPRLAFIHHPNPSTTVKFIYGRAFRNPSQAEAYEDDGGVTMLANPDLRPEKSRAYEAVFSRDLSKAIRFLVSGYRSGFSDIVSADFTPAGAIRYRNADQYRSHGVEGTVSASLAGRATLKGSFAWQHAADHASGQTLANSPARIAQFSARAPIWSKRFSATGGVRYVSGRTTLAGAALPQFALADLGLATQRLSRNVDLMAGVRNLFNHRYSDPIQLVETVDSIRARGRICFLTLVWHSSAR